MQYVSLPRAGVSISRVGFGCEQLGGTDWGSYDREETKRAVARAVDLGINVFDTADVYSLGESERCLSAALGPRRHDAFIVTKGGVRWEMRAAGARADCWFDSSPDYLRRALEGSLRRLDVDVIPLYLLHAPDPAVPLERSLEAVVRFKDEGKIRSIGLSNFPLAGIQRAAGLAEILAVQLRYNLLERTPEAELLPWCRERGIGVLAYGPLAEGLLAGKYSETSRFDTHDRRSRLPHFQGDSFRHNLARADRVRQVAEAQSKSPVQVALNWVLANDAVSVAVVGIKTRNQVEDVAGSVGWAFDRNALDG